MCSEGMSVWFACKLCPSFFLNADDFAYHKKKSHVQEFRSTKFIVFEEQTTPPESPPENWVSFLSPKEETIIHKIISSPTATSHDYFNPCNENIQSNRNKEFVEIDLESNKVLIFNSHDNGCDAAADVPVPNYCVELNGDFNSHSDVQVLQNQVLQNRVEPASAGCDFTTDETRDSECSTVIKSTFKSKANSLKNRKRNEKRPVSSYGNILQTVIQSPHNPYVYLKRLKLITIQNALPHSNSDVHPQEHDRSHINTIAEPANEPKVTPRDQEKFCESNSTVISPPLKTKNKKRKKTAATAFSNCQICSERFNSTVELYVHEHICRLKKQYENIVCIPCHLTFGSVKELNEHNRTQHSTCIFTATPETTKGYRIELADDLLLVAPKKQIQSDFVSSICNNKTETNLPPSISHSDLVYKTDCNPDLDLDQVSNSDDFNGVPDPTAEANLNCGDLLEVVKTEYVADGNEDSEIPGVNQDPFELESRRDNALAEKMLILPGNIDATQASQRGFYCASCKIQFIHVREIKEHNKNHHVTPDGKRRFECPYPHCKTISKSHAYIKTHLRHSHSNWRRFYCPHSSCKMSFKTSLSRRHHLVTVHK